MILLAVDTSTSVGGVALLDGTRLVAESRLNVRVTHSERLMGEIHAVLSHAKIAIGDVDVFAVASGPGSFTGLRVGVSTVKGLVFATGKRLVTVPTLEAFAWNLPRCRHDVCPLLDARKKQVYGAVFSWDGEGFERTISEQAIQIDNLVQLIKEPVVFIGEGALLYGDVIRDRLGTLALFGHPPSMVPAPSNVAFLGMKRALRGEFADPVAATPLYLRRSEAEIKTQMSP